MKRMALENLTVFPRADLAFSPMLNVIIGENGSGKSQLLKIAYSVIAASAEAGRLPFSNGPTKATMQKNYAEKLLTVLRPEAVGRLARRGQGVRRCEVALFFNNPDLDVAFDFTTKSKTEVRISKLNQDWQPKAPVFFPTRELLTLYPGFVSFYDQHYIEFPETYRDTCSLLGIPSLKGAREKSAAALMAPLEKAMGGKIYLDNNGRFYLKIPGSGNMEMYLVAEGIRKLAMLARLVANGSLIDKGYLFWDEPESNLNPKLIKELAKVILDLCMGGIQVFIASHSLFLIRELDILAQGLGSRIKQRFFGLRPEEDGVVVEQGDHLKDLQTIVLLDEELTQSDRYMEIG
nr:AAA family ATPase [Acanthopleuribacter pedis]